MSRFVSVLAGGWCHKLPKLINFFPHEAKISSKRSGQRSLELMGASADPEEQVEDDNESFSFLQLVFVVLQESVLHMRSVSTSTAAPPTSSPRPSASKTNCRCFLAASSPQRVSLASYQTSHACCVAFASLCFKLFLRADVQTVTLLRVLGTALNNAGGGINIVILNGERASCAASRLPQVLTKNRWLLLSFCFLVFRFSLDCFILYF